MLYDPINLQKDVWIVIPAYNEGGMIADVVAEVGTMFPNVVVIDDASADETSATARGAGATVLRHPFNLGQGAALQTGIEFALARGASHIVTFDADGQHHIEDVPIMLEQLAQSGADLALGSRFLGNTVGMSQSRGLLLKAATLFTQITTGLKLTDCHNGLRVFTAEAASKLNLRQNRMAHASEILAGIRKNRFDFVEVPVTITYSDYSREKGQTFTDAFVIFRDLIAARLLS
ncbi:MAG: glycosyltransferase family 2 protein [Parasphingorhabdus sp.]|uniref:glycosyltransferase family 2 protein n=1 Tax=Parasphingorhabdus sp. TaxID=2709688 RepID=UPI0032987FCF